MDDTKGARVLIGCVTHDKHEAYVTDFLAAIRSQDYGNFDVLFVDTSANDDYTAKLRGSGYIVTKGEAGLDHSIKRITSGRNVIREYALAKGYDYVWFVDTDVIPPKDALTRLLSSGKDINAGICLVSMNVDGSIKAMPNIYRFDGQTNMMAPLQPGSADEKRLEEISAAGFGCVLVSSKALSEVTFRYFAESMAGEDIAFFTDAKEKGLNAFADWTVRCAHLIFPPGDPRNKRFMFDG
jgi:cellulose synthase/poly-beta-1,6-N-acetylglucosamine synthase-like glycosyltransferase